MVPFACVGSVLRVCACMLSSSRTGHLSWENRPLISPCPPFPTPPPPSLSWGRGTCTVSVTTARCASWRSLSSTPAASCPTPQVNQHTQSLLFIGFEKMTKEILLPSAVFIFFFPASFLFYYWSGLGPKIVWAVWRLILKQSALLLMISSQFGIIWELLQEVSSGTVELLSF